ncbi:MAG TPA: TonB-dependent receptor, partial [Vicinamibacterales bacterium]|nr:TonB-dependent receptor [Vicinamibacterales bacterium]
MNSRLVCGSTSACIRAVVLIVPLLLASSAAAQETSGSIEGTVSDQTGSAVVGARIVARHLETGLTREGTAGGDGFFRLPLLPIGDYSVTVEAPNFTTAVQQPVTVAVSQTVRLDVPLEVSSIAETVNVSGDVRIVDTVSNALGRVVTGRELVDLPLNGRNFTQLGLLQTGVAPLTAGVALAGGSLRQGQAYAVNGMRPEQNVYLVDGSHNMNRMDGGFALKIPVDAIAEFRILTQSAPPEYGGTAGATTSVVTRSGSNELHGSLYDFVRNDAFDARNFFSREVEPLNQHQFGGTLGGPLQTDRMFFFGYYEGFRNKQGITTTATVPTAEERQGNFSAMGVPLRNFAAGGIPFPNNQIPQAAMHPIARRILDLYPLGNVAPSIYRETLIGRNEIDQVGARVDFNIS